MKYDELSELLDYQDFETINISQLAKDVYIIKYILKLEHTIEKLGSMKCWMSTKKSIYNGGCKMKRIEIEFVPEPEDPFEDIDGRILDYLPTNAPFVVSSDDLSFVELCELVYMITGTCTTDNYHDFEAESTKIRFYSDRKPIYIDTLKEVK